MSEALDHDASHNEANNKANNDANNDANSKADLYAVVKIGGSQFSVREGSELEVDYFGAEPGSEHQWDKVLMLKSSSLTLGQPYVPGAEVHFEVMAQSRQPKILVFKKKRRKGYKRLKGHKQPVTQVRVKRIIAPTS